MICKCGCSQKTNYNPRTKVFRDYIHGHNKRGKKFPSTSEKLRQRWNRKGARTRFSNLMKGRKITWADKISASIKKGWDSLTPEEKSKRIRNALRFQLPNRKERWLCRLLRQRFPSRFTLNVRARKSIAGLFPDFIGEKEVVELFGDEWHEQNEIAKRKKAFLKAGYKAAIIWTSELLKNKDKALASIEAQLL